MDSGKIAKIECPLPEISAYLDGELSSNEETVLERHFSVCPKCSLDLQEQKQFLNSLGSTLKNDDRFELPKDFSKRIITTAENRVSGFARNKDIFLTAVICLFLLTAMLLVSAVNGDQATGGLYGFFERSSAIVMMTMAVAYNIFYGITVILRSFTHNETGIMAAVSLLLISIAGIFIFAAFRTGPVPDSSSDLQKQ